MIGLQPKACFRLSRLLFACPAFAVPVAALILSELAKYNSANSLALDPYGLCLYVTFGNLNAGYMNARRHSPLHMILIGRPMVIVGPKCFLSY